MRFNDKTTGTVDNQTLSITSLRLIRSFEMPTNKRKYNPTKKRSNISL